MTRYLLLLLFFVMLTGRVLGVDVSIAPGLSTKNALLYLAAGFILIESAVAHNRKLELLQAVVPFGLLFVYALGTWLMMVFLFEVPTYSARDTLIALKGLLLDQMLMLLVFFYGATKFRDALWLVKGMTWVVVFLIIVALLEMWGLVDLGMSIEHDSGRAAGVFGNPNDYGALLAYFLPAVVALFLTESGVKRHLSMVGMAAAGLSLLLTGSRGALVGVVVGGAIAAFYLRRHMSIVKFVTGGLVVLVLGVGAVVVLSVTDYGWLFERLLEKTATTDRYALSSGRTGLWMVALNEMLAAPWVFVTGFGWDAYSQSIGHRTALHSDYVTYLYNLGVIGLSLWFTSHVGALSEARRALRWVSGETTYYVMAAVFGVVAMLIASLFNDLHIVSLYTWAMTGAVLRLAATAMSEAHPTASSVA